ncbi:MAG: hypothetical protein NWR72_11465 [Bacteroidia bacterium]|nr:hypothetical protein [Bacteroidia bacterium]
MTIYDRAIKEGVTKGIEQGIQEGIELGIQIGIQLGLQIAKENTFFKVFKNGLNMGMSISDLISITEITMEKAIAWQKRIEEEGAVKG